MLSRRTGEPLSDPELIKEGHVEEDKSCHGPRSFLIPIKLVNAE